MNAIIVHGLLRTPLSMLTLAKRLRKAGIEPHLFYYCAAFEKLDDCRRRLASYVSAKAGTSFIVIGHSLGTVLLRSILSGLRERPLACFYLAPPTKACSAAKYFGSYFLFRLLTGSMGQKLGDNAFMEAIPASNVPSTIYVGTAGPRAQWLPFEHEVNDGILAASETELPGSRVVHVKAIHSFIMNSEQVIKDIIDVCEVLKERNTASNVQSCAPRLARPV